MKNNKLVRYVHLGTGNYHAGNARIYTDYGLLTTDKELCEDVHRIFQELTGMGKMAKLKKLLHAPFTLHAQLINFIDEEIANAKAGKPAQIIVKVNALTEMQLINKLYEASQAGVKIDLIIRSICCLRPGLPGLSENIRVRSIVGRFRNIPVCITLAIMAMPEFTVQVRTGWIVIYLTVLKLVFLLKIRH